MERGGGGEGEWRVRGEGFWLFWLVNWLSNVFFLFYFYFFGLFVYYLCFVGTFGWLVVSLKEKSGYFFFF